MFDLPNRVTVHDRIRKLHITLEDRPVRMLYGNGAGFWFQSFFQSLRRFEALEKLQLELAAEFPVFSGRNLVQELRTGFEQKSVGEGRCGELEVRITVKGELKVECVVPATKQGD